MLVLPVCSEQLLTVIDDCDLHLPRSLWHGCTMSNMRHGKQTPAHVFVASTAYRSFCELSLSLVLSEQSSLHWRCNIAPPQSIQDLPDTHDARLSISILSVLATCKSSLPLVRTVPDVKTGLDNCWSQRQMDQSCNKDSCVLVLVT